MSDPLIIATIGPSLSQDIDLPDLEKAIQAGADGFRLNLTHSTLEEHARIIQHIREKWPHMFLLGDLPGKKLRLGSNFSATVIENGFMVYLTQELTGSFHFSVAPDAWEDIFKLPPAQEFYFSDGTIKLRKRGITEHGSVQCEVIAGGGNVIKPRAGICIPGQEYSVDQAFEADRDYIAFAAAQKIPYIGIAFTQSKDHIQRYRATFVEHGAIPFFEAKIEDKAGAVHLEEIAAEADRIMMGRGDFGTSVGIEHIPYYQDMLIQKCKKQKPVDIASRIQESMEDSDTPSLADIEDIYHLFALGVDGLILTDVTAYGKYPIKAIEWLAKLRSIYNQKDISHAGVG